MKRLLMVLPLLLVVGGEAAALDGTTRRDMTCAEAKATSKASGKALLYYPFEEFPGCRATTYLSPRPADAARLPQMPSWRQESDQRQQVCAECSCVAWQRPTYGRY